MVLVVPFPTCSTAGERLTYLAQNPDEYGAVTLPPAVQQAMGRVASSARGLKFGSREMKQLFTYLEGITFLNHGSWGGVPKCVQDMRVAWLELLEAQPVDAHTEYGVFIAAALRDLGCFINADPQDLVFVNAATIGTNTVLKQIGLGEGDVVLTTSLAYPGVISTLAAIGDAVGARTHIIDLPLPTSRAKILAAFEAYFGDARAGKAVMPKAAIFDHITSSTGLVLPVHELVDICKRHGVLTVVDAAHAIGHVAIDIKRLDPDFYVSNLHKWLFAPRAVAVLYIKRAHQAKIHPLVTSWGYPRGIQPEFFWQSTSDPTPFLTAPAALAFWRAAMGDAGMRRNAAVTRLAGAFLAAATGGSLLVDDGEAEDMLAMLVAVLLPPVAAWRAAVRRVDAAGYKRSVTRAAPLLFDGGLPAHIEFPAAAPGKPADADDGSPEALSPAHLAVAMHDQLRRAHGHECWCTAVQGGVSVRVTVNVYNVAGEYVALARALRETLELGPLDEGLASGFVADVERADAEWNAAKAKAEAGM